jgi:ankyrin repeat protein
LIDAVKRGDLQAARALVARGVDVNAGTPDGTTALHWAAHRNSVPLVDLLLHAGARVTVANDYDATPLSVACEAASAPLVERLLTAGADPNTTVTGGETVLMIAARGNADVVRVLLAHGAKPNAKTAFRQQTALMWAAADNNVPAIRALVEAGAEVSARAKDPTAAYVAAQENSRIISGGSKVEGGKAEAENMVQGFSAPAFAARAGHRAAMRALLDAGVPVDEHMPDGTTALHIATTNAHWELAANLLDRGANPNAVGNGVTPLHLIAWERTVHYTISTNGLPAPAATGTISSLDLVRRLIAHGANVNARAEKNSASILLGATPLLVATAPADPPLMRLLLELGADPHATTADGTNLIMLAGGTNLRTQTIGDDEAAYEALQIGLTIAGIDINAVNQLGDTALHGAAFRGFNPIVQLLVDHGAKLDVKNAQGRLPVEVAHAEFRIVMTAHRPETEALLTRLMEQRNIPVPRQLTPDEFEERYVQRGPEITCPAAPLVSSPDSRSLRVTFGSPMAINPSDGKPVSGAVLCTPSSGTEFPPGSTTVTCTATDRIGRSGSCSFTVKVAIPTK